MNFRLIVLNESTRARNECSLAECNRQLDGFWYEVDVIETFLNEVRACFFFTLQNFGAISK